MTEPDDNDYNMITKVRNYSGYFYVYKQITFEHFFTCLYRTALRLSHRTDQLEQDFMIFRVEGQAAAQHFVHDHSEAPPVHRLVVVILADHLRRQVLGCAAKGLRGFPVEHLLLAQAEVGDLDVAVLVEQNVFELQITAEEKFDNFKKQPSQTIGLLHSEKRMRASAMNYELHSLAFHLPCTTD